ncbi:hypothetical protein KAH27_04720 [bacterium]|nr:hypothetical protein [bacterium]
MAENIFPVASKQLSSRGISIWYSKIAVVAAKGGDKNNAMRIWKDMANLYPYQTNSLKELANLS